MNRMCIVQALVVSENIGMTWTKSERRVGDSHKNSATKNIVPVLQLLLYTSAVMFKGMAMSTHLASGQLATEKDGLF